MTALAGTAFETAVLIAAPESLSWGCAKTGPPTNSPRSSTAMGVLTRMLSLHREVSELMDEAASPKGCPAHSEGFTARKARDWRDLAELDTPNAMVHAYRNSRWSRISGTQALMKPHEV